MTVDPAGCAWVAQVAESGLTSGTPNTALYRQTVCGSGTTLGGVSDAGTDAGYAAQVLSPTALAVGPDCYAYLPANGQGVAVDDANGVYTC